MTRPIALSAADWFFNIVALVGALVVVGGFVFVAIMTQGDRSGSTPTPIAEDAQRPTPQMPIEAASRTPVGANLQLEAEQRVRSGVYRCLEGGSLVYADQPCPKGREAGRQSTIGYQATPLARTSDGPRTVTAREATSSAPVTRESGAPDGSRMTCQEIDADLAQLNTRARAGGSAPYQEWLRDQRRRLVDEKQRLKC